MIKVKDTVAPVSSGDHVFIEDGAMKMKTVDGSFGETILDKFAGLVLQGWVSKQSWLGREDSSPKLGCDKEELAEFCYDVAEFMMDEKRKREAKAGK